jgi:hypothetical protein
VRVYYIFKIPGATYPPDKEALAIVKSYYSLKNNVTIFIKLL